MSRLETVGLSRVEELENILGEILDRWDGGELLSLVYIDNEEEDQGAIDLMDRARRILDREEEGTLEDE
jgi:hypothetical protein